MAVFTRDLRVHDNPALVAARHRGDALVPLFVLDDTILASPYTSANKAAFLAAALSELNDELRGRGGRLIVRRGQVVAEVARLVEQLSISEVHIASDASGYSAQREQRLRDRLDAIGCALHVHTASVTVCEPGALTPLGGADHFAVFTPYYRKWIHNPTRKVLPAPSSVMIAETPSNPLPTASQLCRATRSPQLRVGGETSGRRLMSRWLAGPIDRYHDGHDDLAADATSRLSPYLHFGCLSPVELAHRATPVTDGREAFLRQLAWRDFHHQVLAAHPAAARTDYRPGRDPCRHDPQQFEAWCAGRTGYPIVDAGMRQLAAEGWMHNRARLITASFLTKTLHLDWRLGAAHFMSLLVDADVANNQLNWQWVAGTGTDSRPHRVLNPLRQAQRYDPTGDYVRRWIPELAHVAGPRVHTPWELDAGIAPDYPPRIVDHLDAVRRRDTAAEIGRTNAERRFGLKR